MSKFKVKGDSMSNQNSEGEIKYLREIMQKYFDGRDKLDRALFRGLEEQSANIEQQKKILVEAKKAREISVNMGLLVAIVIVSNIAIFGFFIMSALFNMRGWIAPACYAAAYLLVIGALWFGARKSDDAE